MLVDRSPARNAGAAERRFSLATQIGLLAALQEIDQRLQTKERALQELRQQVTAIAFEIETKQREAEEQQQRINELETQRRAVEGQLKEEESKIKEKRVRLNRIRNERELLALRREIDMLKEANGKLEDDALLLMEQIEKDKGQITQTYAQIEESRARITQQTAQSATQTATLEAEIQRERAEREEIARMVDVDLHARYERLFAKRGGLVIVELRAGICQGCHMRIPPHMCNQLRSSSLQDNAPLFHCPHCGRILYWRTEPEGASNA